MSSYRKQTIHPETKQIENAEWLDDYFGNHNYGVRFPSDGKVFRADEFDWATNKDTLVWEGILKGGNINPVTVVITEKGSYWDHPKHEVSEENGKKVDVTKHEDGRQDVHIEVKRLDLKDRTPEDTAAEEKIIDAMSKTKVGVLVICKLNNDNIYFTCSLPNVRKNAEMVINKYCNEHPEHACTSADFIVVESAVVTDKPKVTTL